MKLRWCRINW